MSTAVKTRTVGTVAASRRVEARGGKRLGRQAWQDIRQACRLAAENECVRAVDIYGVHISFSTTTFCHGNIAGGCTFSSAASASDELAAGARATATAAELAAERKAA